MANIILKKMKLKWGKMGIVDRDDTQKYYFVLEKKVSWPMKEHLVKNIFFWKRLLSFIKNAWSCWKKLKLLSRKLPNIVSVQPKSFRYTTIHQSKSTLYSVNEDAFKRKAIHRHHFPRFFKTISAGSSDLFVRSTSFRVDQLTMILSLLIPQTF